MRLFIAVPLPAPHVEWLLQRGMALRNAAAAASSLRWTPPSHWHVTLTFLGECPADRVDVIDKAMSDAAHGFSPFRFSLGTFGTFGGRQGGLLWVGVETGKESLSALADDVRERLASVGFPQEKKPFQAHVTLARSRGRMGRPNTILSPPVCPEAFVDRIALFESRLSASGAQYFSLKQALLRLE